MIIAYTAPPPHSSIYKQDIERYKTSLPEIENKRRKQQ